MVRRDSFIEPLQIPIVKQLQVMVTAKTSHFDVSYPAGCEDWRSSSKNPQTTLNTVPPAKRGKIEKVNSPKSSL